MEWSTQAEARRQSEPKMRPSEGRVRSGYPIWSLIDAWYASGESDDVVRADFDLDAGEWAEAKAYYSAHRPEIDALRTRNAEETTPVPGAITLEDLFAARKLQA
jgi:hypothetical protein